MTDTAAPAEVEQEPMSQEDADLAFERDLASAGLLDSSLENEGDTLAEPKAETPAGAVATDPGAKPDGVAQETPVVPGQPDATIAGETKELTAEELVAKAVPFSFTSDGQQSTVDVIREIPGEGLVIEQANVEKFRNMIQTADKALRDNVKLREQESRYEKLGGTEKYRELESRSAALDAMGTELLKIINNPEQLISLATDPRERALLLRELQFMGNSTAQTAGQKFGDSLNTVDAGRTQETQDATAFEGALQSIYKALPMLTAEDQQAIRVQFSQPGMKAALYRTSTAADAKYGIPPGQRIIDIPLMHPYAEQLARIRQRQTVAEQNRIRAENENRLRNPAPATPPKKPLIQRGKQEKKAEPEWKDFKRNMLAGRFTMSGDE